MTVKPPSVEMVELEYLERVRSGVRARRKLLSILWCNIFLEEGQFVYNARKPARIKLHYQISHISNVDAFSSIRS